MNTECTIAVLISKSGRKCAFYAIGLLWLFLSPVTTLGADTVDIKPDDLLFGTWVNEEYEEDIDRDSKLEIFANGNELVYKRISDTTPRTASQNVFENVWIDDQGFHWYKMRTTIWTFPSGAGKQEGFQLLRLDPAKLCLESVFAQHGYPSEVTPQGSFYRIRYKVK